MSQEWDYYFARINDAASSVFVDLGLRPDAPLEKRPWLLWVWVQLQLPKADGLSSAEEAPQLHALGEAFDSTICATCGAQLVGRVTGNGRREFYFYAAEPGELAAAVASVMKNSPDYRHECGSTYQPEWDQYFMLYPSDSNLERMRNRGLLEALAADGDVHEVPRKVEHWFAFADEAARAACREIVTAMEFVVEDECHDEEESEGLPYALVASHTGRVDSHTINGITIELARLAREHNGRYDGWACAVTRAAPGMMASLRNIAITLLVLVALLAVSCQALVRSALFFPTHDNRINGLTPWMHEGKLIGFSRLVARPVNVWLMLHGNGGQAADRVYALERFSASDSLFILEYPGYGLRPGSPSRASFDAAALSAYELLRTQFPDKPLCVISESIGSGPASTLARATKPPDKFVFVVPFDTLQSVAHEHVPYLPTSLILAGSWNNVESLADYTGPIDVFGAQSDQVIPVGHARNLAASRPQARFQMISGGHNDWWMQAQVSIRNP